MYKDLTGLTFGNWSVLNFIETKKYVDFWNCLCKCGNIRRVRGNSLISGGSSKCNVCQLIQCRESNFVDLAGQIFDSWTIVKFSHFTKNGANWVCSCKCGHVETISSVSLRRNRNKKCKSCQLKDKIEELENKNVGRKIGCLTILKCTNYNYGRASWQCQCVCGNIEIYSYQKLKDKGGRMQCKKCQNKDTYCGEISLNFYHKILRQAQQRNKKFEITHKYLWELYLKQYGKCALSGVPIEFAETNLKYLKGETSASLDRISSDGAYVPENVQWVHKDVNYMKCDYEQDYFIDMCGKIYHNCRLNPPVIDEEWNFWRCA